jgi:acetate kinase
MEDYALVLNAGSSSLKFCVFHRPSGEDWRLESRGQIEGIGKSPRLIAKDGRGDVLVDGRIDAKAPDGRAALEILAQWLRATYGRAQLLGVGHRVVHGGTRYQRPVVVNPGVLAELHQLVPLAPLHQPYNLAAIETVCERLPGVPQVACFDTAFHRGRAPVAELIPLPGHIRRGEIQRYGFHGLSYEYIASVLPEVAPEIAKRRVIVAHLGSGASLCAMEGGRSVDTTFGFTALDGLCMGTRPGAIDPGVILYLIQTLGFSAKKVESILYQKSGLLGISGTSNDMRDLVESSDPAARLAVDYFVYRAAKEIGAMAAVLRGVDGIVFTGGVGENSPAIRQRICEASAWLGIELDCEANMQRQPRISGPTSRVPVWVIPTNEELMIARHTGLLLGLIAAPA